MTAIAAAIGATNMKHHAMTFGPHGNAGATIKVLTVTPPTTYTAGGDALDLSSFFRRRIYFAVPINPTVNNGSNTYAQVSYVPGTAKTDLAGGYLPTNGKIQFSAGATESSGDMSLYAFKLLVCGC
jgi:hypothetical protein